MNETTEPSVYMIKNKTNGKVYIGSAVNPQERRRQHINDLKKKRHHSVHLQRAWDRYGEDNFEFKIIETVADKNNLIEREQFFMDYYLSYNKNKGYNLQPKANNSLGYKHTNESKRNMSIAHIGKILSDDTKRKISIATSGENNHNYGKGYKFSGENHPMYGKKRSAESKRNMSIAHIGNKLSEETKRKLSIAMSGENHPIYGKQHSEISIEKMSMSSSQKWIVTSPDGVVFSITNLYKYCQHNNLNNGHMYQVAKGNIPHHKGWKCKKLYE